jgi:hypothetical protein
LYPTEKSSKPLKEEERIMRGNHSHLIVIASLLIASLPFYAGAVNNPAAGLNSDVSVQTPVDPANESNPVIIGEAPADPNGQSFPEVSDLTPADVTGQVLPDARDQAPEDLTGQAVPGVSDQAPGLPGRPRSIHVGKAGSDVIGLYNVDVTGQAGPDPNGQAILEVKDLVPPHVGKPRYAPAEKMIPDAIGPNNVDLTGQAGPDPNGQTIPEVSDQIPPDLTGQAPSPSDGIIPNPEGGEIPVNTPEDPLFPAPTKPYTRFVPGAYPNPFNPSTTIGFELRAASYVSLKVYDISGRLVSTLAEGFRNAGNHQAVFDASNLATGMYLYTLQAEGQTAIGKMMLVK